MKKILITGASGFIGKNLVDFLNEDYRVLAPGHKDLDLLDAIAVEEYLKEEKPDVVIHSAVQGTLGLPKEYEEVVLKNNLQMFFHLKRCNQYYGKMYYLGSGAEYGKEGYIPQMKEEYFDTVVPKDDYGLSKYIMAQSMEADGNIYDLRLFGVFGPYENYNYRFISNCICKVLQNRDIIIRRNVFFDYLYIKDLCNIMRWFVEHNPKEKYYNVCTGNAIDIYTIAQKVVKTIGSSSKIIVENENLGPEYSGDNNRLLQEMGGYVFTDIDRAIEELVHFYQGFQFELSSDY